MKLVYIFIFFYNEIKQLKANILIYLRAFNQIKLSNFFCLLSLENIKSEHLKKGNFLIFLNKIKRNYFTNQIKYKDTENILVDLLVDHTEYVMINLLIARELQCFVKKPVICFVYNKDYKTKLIANQFGFENIIYIKKENIFKKFSYFLKAIKIFEKVKKEKKYNNFKLSNIEIGKMALENFFRFNKNFYGKGEAFFKILNLSKSCLYFNFFKNICIKKKVSHLVIGENQFLPHRVIFNLCLKNKIKVFTRFGDAFSGIKIRVYKNYSDRYSHKEKYSKKVMNYYTKELSKNKNNLDNLYQKQKKYLI